MSLSLLLILSFCSCSYGYNSKRQLGAYHWYDQAVLPTGTSFHQNQLFHHLRDRAAVVFTPQYSELEIERKSEPEQVATDYRLARVYPVMIHFLAPEPLDQSANLEVQYQLTLEPVPEYHMMEIEESKYTEKPTTDRQANNETERSKHLQFGTKVTSASKSYSAPDKPSSKTRTENSNGQ